MRPDKESPLAKLQARYVRLRITNMAEVDIGVFEFDFNTTFGLFVMNHRRQIYLRYGARTDESAESFLSLASAGVALERGLTLHEQFKAGKLDDLPIPVSRMSQTYPNVRNIVRKGECVHCHQVAEGYAEELFKLPTFNKKTDVWIYPDPAKLGLALDTDDPTIVKTASGAARKAGIQSGEQIEAVAGKRVSTFADIQYHLHELPREQRAVVLTTNRGKRTITLPPYWRVTDLNRRSIGHKMEPFPGFWGRPLTAAEKKALNLSPESFATKTTRFWVNTHGKQAGLREGDVILSVDGVSESPLAVNAHIHIRLNHKAGDKVKLVYLRGREKRTAEYSLKARPW